MEKYNCMTILYVLHGSRKEKYGPGKQCICRCDCGRLFKRPYRNIIKNKIKMCKECSNNLKKQQKHYSNGNVKHNKSHTRLYRIYHGIKNRCYNKNTEAYKKWYGLKNIIICNEWKNDFMKFYDWAINNGYDDTLSIDRIDNTKGYQPDNCRWTTPHIQSINRTRHKNNKTGYIGIYKYIPKRYKTKKIFGVQIAVNKKRYFLGRFETIELAIQARNEFLQKNKLKEYKIQ